MKISSTRIDSGADIKNKQKIDGQSDKLMADQVAKDFETMFVDLMLKSMRNTVKPEDSSNAQEIYTGMLDGEYAKAMTEANDFGIRKMITDWMKTVDGSPKLDSMEAKKAMQEYQGMSQLGKVK